jgi:hypothetical protein
LRGSLRLRGRCCRGSGCLIILLLRVSGTLSHASRAACRSRLVRLLALFLELCHDLLELLDPQILLIVAHGRAAGRETFSAGPRRKTNRGAARDRSIMIEPY